MSAKAIMIQGTGSHVGKSVMAAAFCRILRQDGFRVAPFKAQNMSNNSFVTRSGGEIGRAQAVQAEACGIEPTIYMNPILLKPSSDLGAQVILLGKSVKTMQAGEYQFHTSTFINDVRLSLERLMEEYDVVVIEGAGSPAEINLQEHDIVNMRTAEMADAPVILVGDIDRGGVFASFIGTLELIQPHYRNRIKAFLINKFRGDQSLLQGGIDFLLGRTAVPTLGVIPYESRLDLLEEDGLSDERIKSNGKSKDSKNILIDVIWLPRISNFTDFSSFDRESDVTLTYLRQIPERFPDVVILPGTKSTIADLNYIRASGFDRWIESCREHGVQIIGICGGYQMLGSQILDPLMVESNLTEISGLGILKAETTFEADKTTHQIAAIHLETGIELKGYEIHMGQTKILEKAESVFKITRRGNHPVFLDEGASISGSQIWGSYLHGIFDCDSFRHHFLNQLRIKKQMPLQNQPSARAARSEIYDRLATLVRSNIDVDLFYRILNSSLRGSDQSMPKQSTIEIASLPPVARNDGGKV